VIFAAAGDNDAGDGTSVKTVDLPAGCPAVLGCGGTRLVQGGPETVWNDQEGEVSGEGTGGGYSAVFPPQSWQAGVLAGPGRAVPDVSANADPVTGYHIYLDGSWQIVGGTSAVAPLYAGLFAAFGKKLGWISPKLWSNHLAFNLITQGDNGYFRAGDSPRPPCGLGSPIGTKLAALFA
jgi:subtilase family serine protease